MEDNNAAGAKRLWISPYFGQSPLTHGHFVSGWVKKRGNKHHLRLTNLMEPATGRYRSIAIPKDDLVALQLQMDHIIRVKDTAQNLQDQILKTSSPEEQKRMYALLKSEHNFFEPNGEQAELHTIVSQALVGENRGIQSTFLQLAFCKCNDGNQLTESIPLVSLVKRPNMGARETGVIFQTDKEIRSLVEIITLRIKEKAEQPVTTTENKQLGKGEKKSNRSKLRGIAAHELSRWIRCKKCHFKTKRHGALSKHNQEKHGSEELPTEGDIVINDLQCKVCGKQFTTKRARMKHERTIKHGETPTI